MWSLVVGQGIINYLTSGMKYREIAEMRRGQVRKDEWGEVGNELDNMSPVYQLTSFCDHLVCSMKFDCTQMKNIDEI